MQAGIPAGDRKRLAVAGIEVGVEWRTMEFISLLCRGAAENSGYRELDRRSKDGLANREPLFEIDLLLLLK